MNTSTIFIDTEFTDFKNPQLISIGLAINQEIFFYKEFSSYQKKDCSDFTTQMVLPLLNQKPEDMETIKISLNKWLEDFSKEIIIVGDHWGDWLLFKKLLNPDHRVIGFVNIEDFLLKEAKKRIPSLHPILVKKEFNSLIDFFFRFQKKWYTDNEKPSHHALNDALANQFAFDHILQFTQ